MCSYPFCLFWFWKKDTKKTTWPLESLAPWTLRFSNLKFQSVKAITLYFYGKFKNILWFVLDTLDFHPEKAEGLLLQSGGQCCFLKTRKRLFSLGWIRFLEIVARSSSNVLKLWTGRFSFVRFDRAFCWAEGERLAGSTTDSRFTSPAIRSSLSWLEKWSSPMQRWKCFATLNLLMTFPTLRAILALPLRARFSLWVACTILSSSFLVATRSSWRLRERSAHINRLGRILVLEFQELRFIPPLSIFVKV